MMKSIMKNSKYIVCYIDVHISGQWQYVFVTTKDGDVVVLDICMTDRAMLSKLDDLIDSKEYIFEGVYADKREAVAHLLNITYDHYSWYVRRYGHEKEEGKSETERR